MSQFFVIVAILAIVTAIALYAFDADREVWP